jgi:hypothetical protein
MSWDLGMPGGGPSDAESCASDLPSGWSPLELLKHVVFMQRWWFVWRFAGRIAVPPAPFRISGATGHPFVAGMIDGSTVRGRREAGGAARQPERASVSCAGVVRRITATSAASTHV